MSKEKPKFPRKAALDVVRELLPRLEPACEIIKVAGSLRRKRAMVGDVELVFVPRLVEGPRVDMFGPRPMVPVTNAVFDWMLAEGVIEKRESKLGRESWGPKNKYARHCASGIPVDFFATAGEGFANYMVCRTGGARNNVAICNAAISKGWKWNPYDGGFSRLTGLGIEQRLMSSEREVFEFVGLPYKEPWDR